MLNNPAISNNIGSFTNSTQSIGVISNTIGAFISLAFGGGAIILLFILLYGAYEYITSGGDKEGTQKATKRITAGLIGLALLFSIYALIALVQTIFGISLFNIAVPTLNRTS